MLNRLCFFRVALVGTRRLHLAGRKTDYVNSATKQTQVSNEAARVSVSLGWQ